MTLTEFYDENCVKCGSLHCPQTEEAISICGYYKGNITGIEKKESMRELLQRIGEAFKIYKVLIICGDFND